MKISWHVFDCWYVSMAMTCPRIISWCLPGWTMGGFTCFSQSDSIQFQEYFFWNCSYACTRSILNWTSYPFKSNSTIYLLCADIISTVPRKGSLLTVSAHIVAKFVTDLHNDLWWPYFLHIQHVASQARHLDVLETRCNLSCWLLWNLANLEHSS